jgi:hypothetical protein
MATDCATKAEEKALRTPFAIAEHMLRRARELKDLEAFKQAIELFDNIKRAQESADLK